MLIDLKPIGGKGSVNPEYVTSIEVTSVHRTNQKITKIWVRGNSGYGTYDENVSVLPAEARQYLNNPTRFLLLQRVARIAEALANLSTIIEASNDDDAIIFSNEIGDSVMQLEELADEL